MTPTFDRVRGIAADIFQLPPAQLTADSCPDNVAVWDSVQHLNLVLALEEQFGVQFDPDEIDKMKNLGIIASLLDSRNQQN